MLSERVFLWERTGEEIVKKIKNAASSVGPPDKTKS